MADPHPSAGGSGFTSATQAPNSSLRPIFIGGCERSGTTLLGSMLGAHSDAIVTPESQFKTDVLHTFVDPDDDPRAVAGTIARHWRYQHWNVQLAPDELDLTGYGALLASLVRAYGARSGRTGSVWVDHSPNNVRYASHLLGLFPGARFVHIVRDARAVIASVVPLDWGPNSAFVGASWWVERLAHGLALETAQPDRVTRVRFEDLVAAPEPTMRALCARLELTFEPAMLQGGGLHPVAYTSKQHRLVGGQPAIGRGSRPARSRSSRPPRSTCLRSWATSPSVARARSPRGAARRSPPSRPIRGGASRTGCDGGGG